MGKKFLNSLLAVAATIFVATICFAEAIEENLGSGEDLTNLNRVKRQHVITESFKSLRCNRKAWKSTMEPYLKAEGKSQRDPTNEVLKTAFQNALKDLNDWKRFYLALLPDVCNLQNFLECGEDGRCVCGMSGAPYNFQPEDDDSDTCLAMRGSICRLDQDCIKGLKCKQFYCGGVSAFFEESDKEMDSSEESDADGTGCWEKAVGFNVLMSIILTLSTL